MSARPLARAAVVTLSALSALALGTSPAGAAPGLTIALDPPQVEVYLVPVENYADAPLADDDEWYTPIEVEWGGAVVVRLPDGLDGAAATWMLDTGSDMDDAPTRSLSTGADGADHLAVSDLGGGAHRIDLPADDGTSGPVGLVTVEGVGATQDGIEAVDPLFYLLELTGTGTSVVTLEPQLSALSSVPCGFDLRAFPDGCPPYQVTAGDTVGLTVPDGSLLRSLGFGQFDDVAVGLSPVDHDGWYDEPYDEEYDQGYSAGYDDGYAEIYGKGYGDGYLASYGEGYSEEEGHDAGYQDGLADGRADGAADARRTAPDPTPAEAMARVAALTAAVDEATDGTTAGASRAPAPRVAPATAAEGEGSPLTATEHLASDGLLPLTLTPSGAEVTLPAGTGAGTYELVVLEGSDAVGPTSSVFLTLEVAAAPLVGATAEEPGVAPLDRGLVSETGWTDPAVHRGPSPLVALGGGAVLAAGLGAALVLRPRRRAAEH